MPRPRSTLSNVNFTSDMSIYLLAYRSDAAVTLPDVYGRTDGASGRIEERGIGKPYPSQHLAREGMGGRPGRDPGRHAPPPARADRSARGHAARLGLPRDRPGRHPGPR